jgi:hypothetical protein
LYPPQLPPATNRKSKCASPSSLSPSFSFSLLVGTTLAADCGGSQHLSHAVFDSYDKYHQACDVAMSSTNGGYGFHEQDSLNIKMQVQLTASHVNNGYAGMQNIVDQCFRNGWNGEVWS